MTCMKLQKLAFYSQAWSLVWDDLPLFDERIEAWVNGPVSPALYDRHRGQFQVAQWRGDATQLNQDQRETVDAVINFYGKHSSQQLSQMTHQEEPWIKARRGLGRSERGNREITLASMADYYGGL